MATVSVRSEEVKSPGHPSDERLRNHVFGLGSLSVCGIVVVMIYALRCKGDVKIDRSAGNNRFQLEGKEKQNR